MALSLSHWRPRHLLLAWVAYWVALLATIVRPAISHALAAVAAPEGHGTISASMANGVLSFVAKSDTASWTGSASLLSIALWFAGPPLVLWAVWAATRSHPIAARERIS